MRLRTALFTAATLAVPVGLSGQGVGEMMSTLRAGGTWVTIPIVAGEGTYSTTTIPTATMTLNGCLNVWPGHSGSWEIDAVEKVQGASLEIEAEPGVGVPFRHQFGMTAQLDFDFRWSEARDTTLYIWVGVDMSGSGDASICEPPPSDG